MEALTRLVTDSLARHGFDRPMDPRRLQWSRWFLCDSPHSLLVVPSKPGIFAIAEEVMKLGTGKDFGLGNAHVGTAAPGCPTASSGSTSGESTNWEGRDLSRAVSETPNNAALAAEVTPKRLLAVLQFFEDDDMAFTLDRMFARFNPMRDRLASGRCFLRFVVIEDQAQRRSICGALNQWILSSAEKASGIPAAFSSSLELNTGRVDAGGSPAQAGSIHLDSGANTNLRCPHPLPSGF